jgi:putative ABC transport system ATP-binding protein
MIGRGKFVAIMGASGSGKSTFMNLLGCLDRPNSGRYLLERTDVSQHDKKALTSFETRRSASSFKDSTYYRAQQPSKTPNCLRCTQKSVKQIGGSAPSRRWHWSDSPIALSTFLRRCREVSNSASRLRALVNRPSILLADEPTGNLDTRTSVEIMEIFQDLNDKGLTIILITHEQDVAQFAKRVLVFRDGKIRKDDLVVNRPSATEVLKTLPTLED